MTVAALTDLPAVFNPASLLPSVEETVPDDVRKAVEDWVLARVLDGLEAAELAAAVAEPAAYERHRQAYDHGRQVAVQGQSRYQWWLGEMWATAATTALEYDVAPGTHGYRALCHDALCGVVEAHAVHEARMAGRYGEETAPAAPPTAAAAPAFAVPSPPKPVSVPAPHAELETAAPPAAAVSRRKREAPDCSADAETGAASGNAGLTLDEALEITIEWKTRPGNKERWCKKTVDQARKVVALFKAVTGLTHTSQVTRGYVLDFRNFLCRTPKWRGRSIYRKLEPLKQVERADEMEDLRVRAKNGDKAAEKQIADRLKRSKLSIDDICKRLCVKTINRSLSQLGAIFEKPLNDEGDDVKVHPAFQSVQFKQAKGKKGQVTPTRLLTPSDLEAIIATEKFQVEFRGGTERYWGFILAGLHGIRRGEVAQLGPADFDLSEAVPTLSLEHATKELKSEAGERVLPIHPLALELGLEHVIRTARKYKQKDLFPSFAWKDNEMERGRDLTRWFTEVLEEAGIKEPGKSLRSLRMGFNTDLTRGDCNDAKRHYLMGHEHEGVNLEHYFGGFRPEDVAHVIVNTRFAEVVRRCLLKGDQNGAEVVPFAVAA